VHSLLNTQDPPKHMRWQGAAPEVPLYVNILQTLTPRVPAKNIKISTLIWSAACRF